MITPIIVIIISVLLILWFKVASGRMAKLAANTPTLKGYVPVIGHLHNVFNIDGHNFYNYMKEKSLETNEYGGVAKLWLGPSLTYIITDPDDALTVANVCLKKTMVYHFVEAFIGYGLLTARNVHVWKRHRKLLIPAFNQHVLDGFMDVFNDQARCLVNRLETHDRREKFDHWPYLAFNALETICRTALGVPDTDGNLVGKEYSNAVQSMLSIAMRRMTKPWLYSKTLYERSYLKKEEDAKVDVFHKMSTDILHKYKDKRKQDELDGINRHEKRFRPFLDLLLDLGADGLFTDQEIREQLDTIIVAGHDTSSTTLLFTLFMLGSHPQVQEKVFKEALDVCGDSDRDLDKDDLNKLVYMEAVLKETLRLYPVGPMLGRFVTKDTKLKNYILPSGAVCIVSVIGLHLNKSCWGDDAGVFRPERWLDPGTLPRNHAFAAFSIGKRNCIGRTYAYMAMKTNLAFIIRKYKITSTLKDLKLRMDMILKPESGCEIAIASR